MRCVKIYLHAPYSPSWLCIKYRDNEEQCRSENVTSKLWKETINSIMPVVSLFGTGNCLLLSFWETIKLHGELHRPTDRRLSAKLVPTFSDRGCHVVSATDPTAVNLGFLDRSHYFLEIAPQLSSRGWVDPVPDQLLLRKFGSTGNRIRTSGSVAGNSDH
jgi:hypothetical protein